MKYTKTIQIENSAWLEIAGRCHLSLSTLTPIAMTTKVNNDHLLTVIFESNYPIPPEIGISSERLNIIRNAAYRTHLLKLAELECPQNKDPSLWKTNSLNLRAEAEKLPIVNDLSSDEMCYYVCCSVGFSMDSCRLI